MHSDLHGHHPDINRLSINFTQLELMVAAGSKHGGSSDIIVRLGRDAWGLQAALSPEYNHISVWCEDCAEDEADFGNAALTCPEPVA
jgi:hypothetical protein